MYIYPACITTQYFKKEANWFQIKNVLNFWSQESTFTRELWNVINVDAMLENVNSVFPLLCMVHVKNIVRLFVTSNNKYQNINNPVRSE